MIHKDIRYRRFERRNHTARKKLIAKHSMADSIELIESPRYAGKLNKGKIHCSCPLCAAKSTKCLGKTNNSLSNYAVSDRRKFTALENNLNEYNEDIA